MDVYWNVYKNLEKEIVALADVIYINDVQKGVYSTRIAELIIRASAEIECLSAKIHSCRLEYHPLFAARTISV